MAEFVPHSTQELADFTIVGMSQRQDVEKAQEDEVWETHIFFFGRAEARKYELCQRKALEAAGI
jgi:hypothetical protein